MNTSSPIVYNDLASLTRLKGQSKEDPAAALHEVAKQFESVFVSMMMKAMRNTLPKDGMLASNELQNYQEMFDQQLSLDLSRKGGLGLADLISRQLAMSQDLAPDAIDANAKLLDSPILDTRLSDTGNAP